MDKKKEEKKEKKNSWPKKTTHTHHSSISKIYNLTPTSKTRHANNGLPHFIPPSPKEQACFNMGTHQPFCLVLFPLLGYK